MPENFLPRDQFEILQQLQAVFLECPDITIAGLLGKFHGTPLGDYVAHLAAKEFLLPKADVAKSFQQALIMIEGYLKKGI